MEDLKEPDPKAGKVAAEDPRPSAYGVGDALGAEWQNWERGVGPPPKKGKKKSYS
jgi:hypothetical protein